MKGNFCILSMRREKKKERERNPSEPHCQSIIDMRSTTRKPLVHHS